MIGLGNSSHKINQPIYERANCSVNEIFLGFDKAVSSTCSYIM